MERPNRSAARRAGPSLHIPRGQVSRECLPGQEVEALSAPPAEDRAVLLMALGGPTSLEEVEPYLRDVRGGRPTPPELVEEFRERYRRIGGRSPLLDVSRAQARALENRLSGEGFSVRCEVGMRHWHPRIGEVVERLFRDGIRDLTGICLTPYFSKWSVGAYLTSLRDAVARCEGRLETRTVDSWHQEPALAEAFAARVLATLSTMADRGFRDPVVLFTAHSLPQPPGEGGDPYVAQLEETRRAIEARLPPVRSRMAYQSVGRKEGPWLGPAMETVMADCARAGESAIVVVPFGFLSDNLEILFDLDVELQERAHQLGLHLTRTDSLNDDPLVIEALAHAVLSANQVP
ncbi:MAG TPA: ferrochelatase [Thermoplasmata archaeon]|nr:ferrochelatase [Thermoplasmata archaeon]